MVFDCLCPLNVGLVILVFAIVVSFLIIAVVIIGGTLLGRGASPPSCTAGIFHMKMTKSLLSNNEYPFYVYCFISTCLFPICTTRWVHSFMSTLLM